MEMMKKNLIRKEVIEMLHFDKEGAPEWFFGFYALLGGHRYEVHVHAYSYESAMKKVKGFANIVMHCSARDIYETPESEEGILYDDEVHHDSYRRVFF